MKPGAIPLLLIAALSMQGCVAAVIPIIAAGAIGKTQVDAAKRTRNAEKGMENFPAIQQTRPPDPIVTVGPQTTDDVATNVTAPPPSQPQTVAAIDPSNPYIPFAEYALAQSAAREAGNAPRGAVLVEDVSLSDPKTISCSSKPMAVVIDVDPSGSAVPVEVDAGLAGLLEQLRAAKIRVAWISDSNATDLGTMLKSASADHVAVANDNDLFLSARSDGRRKEERRWDLAKDFCVIAVAGDSKADFDELYDYLRVPDYAIMLDRYWNRGWFMTPPVLAMQVKGV